MSELVTFVVIASVVLAMPGPTNSLLAAAGAMSGARRAIRLVAAELLGYGSSIACWGFLLRPLVDAHPSISWPLKAACSIYLAWLAWKMWRCESARHSGEHVSFGRLYRATLLNPKGMLFGLVLIPFHAGASIWIASVVSLAALMICIGSAWVMIGDQMGRQARRFGWANAIPKCAATVLALFAVLLLRVP